MIAVNGWMNNPTGFDVNAAGEVTDVRPLEALFNDNLWHELIHMYLAGLPGRRASSSPASTRSPGCAGRRDRYHRAALIVPLAFVALAAPAQLLVGDWAARTVAEKQPTKLAAIEGLEETDDGRGLTIGGIYFDGEVYGGIEIPDLLSLLAFHDPDAKVRGPRRGPRRTTARRSAWCATRSR